MAIFSAVKNRAQSGSTMKNSLAYISRKDKTLWHDHQLVTGHNCVARCAYEEMMTTKQQFKKTGDRMFYHFVQSFSPEEDVTPQEVHTIGLELAQQLFPDFEVVVATHVDAHHLHNHLVVNSVSCQDGHKLHQNAADLQRQREISDEICRVHGLAVLTPAKKHTSKKQLASREYRSAAKGESWKFQLMNAIDLCMRKARTRKEFLKRMERLGYQVRWEDTRKYITYTTPTGKKCRDDRLHDKKYGKEIMEYEFRIREQIVLRGIEAKEYAAAGRGSHTAGADAAPGSLSHAGAVGGAAGLSGRPVSGDGPTTQSAVATGRYDEDNMPHGTNGIDADGKTDKGVDIDRSAAPTGWEQERETAFSAQDTSAQTHAHVAVDHSDLGRIVGDVVELGYALERGQDTSPVRDCTTIPSHIDRKALAKERRRKIAMGHKADDHADQQQTMS